MTEEEKKAYAREAALKREEPRWISVEDRLPETDEWVAVWYLDKDGDCYFTAGKCECDAAGRRYWMTDVDDNARAYPPEEITHWMPLPKPSKENKEENKHV